MKLSKKVLTMGIMAALSVSIAATAAAADLTIKAKEIKSGEIKIVTPVIKGSAGGAAMDAKLTLLAAQNTYNVIYNYLPEDDRAKAVAPEQFITYCNEKSENPVDAGMSYIKEQTSLVNAGFKTAENLHTANVKYQLLMDYNVYTASDSLISLRQSTYAYTGGAHGINTVDTITANAKTGRVYRLGDMFEAGTNYKPRLDKLINIQQIGSKRLAEKMGKPSYDFDNIIINGNEKFYVDSDLKGWGLHILYNQGEVGPMAAGVQNYFIPIDTISDIIDWDIK